jgi:hypothetical protein
MTWVFTEEARNFGHLLRGAGLVLIALGWGLRACGLGRRRR